MGFFESGFDMKAAEEIRVYESADTQLPATQIVNGPLLRSYSAHIPSFKIQIFHNMLIFGSDGVCADRNNLILREEWIGNTGRKQLVCFTRRKRPKIHLDGNTLCLIFPALDNNYYHWLAEIVPLFHLAAKARISIDHVLISGNCPFQKETLLLAGCPEHVIVSVTRKARYVVETLVRPNVLFNHRVTYMGGHKHFQKVWSPHWLKNVYATSEPAGIGDKTFIGRPGAIKRPITNEGELQALVVSQGFHSFSPDGKSAVEQKAGLSNTTTLLAVHGAAMANMFFMPQGSTVIEICDPRYLDSSFRTLTHALGHRYEPIAAIQSDGGLDPNQAPGRLDRECLRTYLENRNAQAKQ
jgi:Glycosyltransferase 61